jgi:lipopolysaccharide export system protein LptC
MSSPTAEHAYHPALLGHDVQRRLHELKRWRTHSRRIRWLRALLPLVIALLLAALLGWAGYNALIAPLSLGARSAGMSIRMINPKFFGRDQGGRPFNVSAASAVRDDNQFQRIYVEKPVLVLGAAPAVRTRVTADKGVYREDTKILTLDSNVHLHDSQGNDFVTSHAVINTVTDDVDGAAAPVAGHGPLGRIASSSYAVRNGGAQVFFMGKVVARIEQGGSPPSPAPPAFALKGPR